MPNETDLFLEELGQDPFEQLNTELEQSEVTQEGEEEVSELKPKNRRERRLMEKVEAEKNSSIQLAERLARLEEARTTTEDADYLKGIERIYGTDSPEAIMATDLLRKAIVGARDDAESRAYERIQSERQRETQAVKEAEAELDSVLDEIEDTYNVELTEAQEVAYFQLMQKMSPKDRNGNVIGLADPYAVFEVFQEKLSKGTTDNRAKELSARSMTQGSTTTNSTLKNDRLERLLKENGII